MLQVCHLDGGPLFLHNRMGFGPWLLYTRAPLRDSGLKKRLGEYPGLQRNIYLFLCLDARRGHSEARQAVIQTWCLVPSSHLNWPGRKPPKLLFWFSISVLHKGGKWDVTLHCPGHVTSRNSYLDIERERLPAGHSSCGNKWREESETMETLGLHSQLCHRARICSLGASAWLASPDQHHTDKALSSWVSPPLPHYKKMDCWYISLPYTSLYQEILEDKYSVLCVWTLILHKAWWTEIIR